MSTLNLELVNTYSLTTIGIADTERVIYGLFSSSNLEVCRYIGYTKYTINYRLNKHLYEAIVLKKNNRRCKWIRAEVEKGNKIVVKCIDSCYSFEETLKKEIYYIKLFKSFGANLVNGTIGGEGVRGCKNLEPVKKSNTLLKSKKIYCFDVYTKELIKIYPSRKIMTEELKLSKTSVTYTLRGKYKHTHGFVFSYDGKFPEREDYRDYTSGNQGIRTTIVFKLNEKIFTMNLKESLSIIKCHYTTLYDHLKSGKKINGYTILNIFKNES